MKAHSLHTTTTFRVPKKPPKTEIEKWRVLKETVMALVVANPPKLGGSLARKQHNNQLSVRFKDRKGVPKWYPFQKWGKGAEWDVTTNHCEIILLRMYEQRLAEHTPNMLYLARRASLEQIRDLEKGVDIEKKFGIIDVLEINEGEDEE